MCIGDSKNARVIGRTRNNNEEFLIDYVVHKLKIQILTIIMEFIIKAKKACSTFHTQFLILFLVQIALTVVEFTTSIVALKMFDFIITAVTLCLALRSPRFKFSKIWESHRLFLIGTCVFFILVSLSTTSIGFFQSTLRILLFVIYQHINDKPARTFQTNASQTEATVVLPKTPSNHAVFHRRRSLSSVLNDDEKWLDLLDQGYFLCDKDLNLIYSNKKGQNLMRDLRLKFEEFAEKLIEVQEPRRSLKGILECLLRSGIEGTTTKAEFGFREDAKEENSPSSFKAGLFCNYKAHIWTLKKDHVLIIMKEKDQFSTLILAEKLGKATNCTLSHELKTLLNAIVGNLDLLEDIIDKEHAIFYRIALSSSHILSSRLNDLFDYIQIQDHEFKLHINEFSIEKLLCEIKQTCKWPARQKRLGFSTSVDDSIPEQIIGDRTRTKQILLNLLTKAIEYTDYGNVSLRVKRKKDCFVAFQVKSVGTGMHYKLLTHVRSFSPKSKKQLCRKSGDSPVGATENMEEMYLEISQLICKEMGTKIIVKGTEKGSSQFSFVLPNALLKDYGQGFPESSKIRPIKSLATLCPVIIKEAEETPKRKQFGIERVVNCGKIENFNIINLNVAGKDSEKFGAAMAQSFLQGCKDQDCESCEPEIPAEWDVHEKISLSHYSLSPKKMPIHIRKSENLRTAPAAHYKSALGKKESRRNLLLKNDPRPLSQMGVGRREKTRRTTMQGSEPNRFSAFRKKKLQCIDDFSSCNVLIVDDNMSNRFVLKSLLKKQGFNSIEAQDGADAVNIVDKYIKSGNIKELLLIYMDLQMPIMNGIESTKSIVALCTTAGVDAPPIIGVSSDPSEEDRCKFEQAGINEFVSKPLDKEKIESTINTHIKKGK